MTVILSLIGLLLRLIAWISTLLVVGGAVLRVFEPKLFSKWMHQMVSLLEPKQPLSANRKADARRRGNQPERDRDVRETQRQTMKSAQTQVQQEIGRLRDENARLRSELDEAQREARDYRTRYGNFRQDNARGSLPKGNASENKTPAAHQSDEAPLRQIYFAFAPTSVQPYGFNSDDWSMEDKGQPFFMQRQSATEAKFSLSSNTAARNEVLSCLAYYYRTIDYEDVSQGQPVGNVKVVSAGQLHKQGDVWTIQSKIKIKIY